MTTITLTANSYADLKPFELMAKRFGILVEMVDKKSDSNLVKFDNMCKEARKFAKKAGITQNDISDAIKKARA